MGSASDAEVVKATSDVHGKVRETWSDVAELVFDDTADLDPGGGMFDAHTDPSQAAVVALLARP